VENNNLEGCNCYINWTKVAEGEACCLHHLQDINLGAYWLVIGINDVEVEFDLHLGAHVHFHLGAYASNLGYDYADPSLGWV